MGKISKSYLKEVAERKKYQSGGFSTEGYKRNSPDVNNPYNVIPSNQITMKGVDFPVLGVDNFGNRQLMEPGSDYTFPGNYVKEFPMRNMGNNRFQDGGAKSPVILPQIDYDLEKAPKQGNFLLSDIDRPFYIDDEGWKRSEYRMGVNVDGKETLIPTVVNGTQLTEDQAIQRYYDTGLHMGQYNTVPESEYASRMRTLKYNMLEDPVRFDTNYQMGGTIGMPGVNGQVVSSGSYPITSVKKTRGSVKKDNKGNVKTMSNQQVKQVLKYSKQKPNKI